MKRYFVTASGTDIGKTVITSGLARQLRAKGDRVTAFKPVITGFQAASAETSDTGRLLTALGQAVTPDAVERLSPWRYAPAVAPDIAAARAGEEISLAALVDFCCEVGPEAFRLVEGVGGVMAPLSPHATTLDWMAALGWPVLLVSGSYLGAISHTLTACHMLLFPGAYTSGGHRQRLRTGASCAPGTANKPGAISPSGTILPYTEMQNFVRIT